MRATRNESYPDRDIAHEWRAGTVYREIVDVEDVDEFQTYVAVPREPTSEIPVVANVAYLTGLDGHNLDSIRKLLNIGIPSIFIDAEGSHRHEGRRSWPEHVRKALSIRLGRTALATNAILRSEALERYETIDREHVIFAGESRGGMAALAAEARHDSPHVLYSDPVAPAMLEHPSFRDLIHYARQVPAEIGAGLQELSHMEPSKAWRYARTVKHPLTYTPYALATAPALIWSNLAKHVEALDEETPRTITVFEKDHWGQPERWERYFKHHPDTEIIKESGRHLKLIRPAITNETRSRIRHVLYEIRYAQRNSNYNFAHVARNGIREYRRLKAEADELAKQRVA